MDINGWYKNVKEKLLGFVGLIRKNGLSNIPLYIYTPHLLYPFTY